MSWIRKYQDDLKNRGWRIQWIPWQKPGETIRVHSSPVSIALALTGVALFLASMFLAVLGSQGRNPFPELSLSHLLIFGVMGLGLALLSTIIARNAATHDWVRVPAKCVDREFVSLRPIRQINMQKPRIVWICRILCELVYKQSEYRVTPYTQQTFAFSSKEKAEKYLNERIADNGDCFLWIDPRNPLRAHFHNKLTFLPSD